MSRRDTRLVRIVFCKVAVPELAQQTAWRKSPVEQSAGEVQPPGIHFAFEPRQAREGETQIGERFVARPPIFGGALNVAEEIGRGRAPMRDRQQRQRAFFVGCASQDRQAQPISPHADQLRAGTEDEPAIQQHCAFIERMKLTMRLEALSQIGDRSHRALRNWPES